MLKNIDCIRRFWKLTQIDTSWSSDFWCVSSIYIVLYSKKFRSVSESRNIINQPSLFPSHDKKCYKRSFLLAASQFEVYSASPCCCKSLDVVSFGFAPTAGKQHTRKSWSRDLGLETSPNSDFWYDDVIYARKYYTKKLTHFKLIWLNRSLVKST